METTETKIKVRLDVEPSVPLPEGIEFVEMPPEELEQFVRELLEENAEVLSGLAQR
ncbi:MAG TPA: hypothetical protein VFS50_01570 [Meiothermus sp.]|nr:hypothetical protein [Meiothermus sp.]